MTAKLEVALDAITLNNAVTLISKIQNDIDIIEVGTPMMMAYGMDAVRTFVKQFPQLEVLCDTKIMDAGAYEAQLALSAGADYVTVLALSDDITIKEVTDAAHNAGSLVMVDMINDRDPQRVATLQAIGADIVAVHTGVDAQSAGRTPLDDLRELRPLATEAQVAVAGGIKADTVASYLVDGPDIVIVGGGILNAKDPVAAAAAIHRQIIGGAR